MNSIGGMSLVAGLCASIDSRSNFGGCFRRSANSAPMYSAISLRTANRSSSEWTGDSGSLTLQTAASDQ